MEESPIVTQTDIKINNNTYTTTNIIIIIYTTIFYVRIIKKNYQ